MTDAKRMYEKRKKLGISQTEMAKKMGYSSQQYISMVENGDRKMSGPARKLLKMIDEES